MSGIAKFFGFNPLWARIIFVVLLFVTGFFPLALVYVILWAVLPPARTAAEKLQMSGEPVTLEKIKTMGASVREAAARDGEYAETTRRVLATLVGIGFICLAFLTLSTTVAGAVTFFGKEAAFLTSELPAQFNYGPTWPLVVAYGLAIVSGLLLASLFVVLAVASFLRRFSKRLAYVVVGIVAAGLLSFGSAAGIVAYKTAAVRQELQRNMQTRQAAVPDEFAAIKTLKIDDIAVSVDYIVSDTPRIEYTALTNDAAPIVTINNNEATIKSPKLPVSYPMHPQALTQITVYGPRLAAIEASNGSVKYSRGSGELVVRAKDEGTVGLLDGSFSKLSAQLGDRGNVWAYSAAVDTVQLAVSGTASSAELGIVKSLTLEYPESCAVDAAARVSVANVTADAITLNGTSRPVGAFETPCLSLEVGEANQQND